MSAENSRNLIEFLKKSDIFADFKDEEILLLLPYIRIMEFSRGDWLIKEGDTGQHLYLIKSGQVEIVKKEEEWGYFQRLDVLGAGEWLGEMAHFEEGKRSASVRALDKVEVIVLLTDELRSSKVGDLFYPKIIRHLTRRISERLRKTGDSLITSLTEKLKLIRSSNQISSALVHIMILFALYINIAKVLLARADEFPTLSVLFPSIAAIAFGLSACWLIRASDYPLSFYGLTMENWKRHALEGLLVSIPIIVLITLIKWGLIHFVSDFSDISIFESPFEDASFMKAFFFITLYLSLVPLQELVARSFLQSCFRDFFQGRYRAFFAILTANLLFEMTHTVHNMSFALSAFFLGFFWGYLFERQKSIVGVCVSHTLIGGWVLFVLNYELVFRAIG